MQAGTKTGDESPAADLEGTWALLQVGDTGMHGGFQVPTLAISGDSVSGFAGVNRFTGQLASEGPFLFGPLATTRMAGPGPAMKLETRYLAALQQATGWQVEGEGDSLMLTSDGNVLATFYRSPAD